LAKTLGYWFEDRAKSYTFFSCKKNQAVLGPKTNLIFVYAPITRLPQAPERFRTSAECGDFPRCAQWLARRYRSKCAQNAQKKHPSPF
jgi:hypothetical protein